MTVIVNFRDRGLLWVAVIASVVALVVVLLFPRSGNPQLEEVARAPLAVGCDLHQQSCQTQFATGGVVTVTLSPQPIAAMVPLQLRVELQELAAEEVAIDFSGVDMYMGQNRFPLLQQAGKEGTYLGEALLPICSRSEMAWQVEVMLRSGGTVAIAPFLLTTRLPRAGGGE
ncbi:MAG: hypothetical protein HQL48_05385 [Gammaproteobacteria bacterium]|nr:hypothetical protein [Gammaproteobacteria bacterium]